MELFWFFAGILSTLAALILLLPWLRTIPRLASLPALPWQAGIVACLIVLAALGLHHWLGRPEVADPPTAQPAMRAASAAGAFADAVSLSDNLANPAPKSSAGSMGSAIAALQGRLSKGGGTADDWELLAKSYEFLGRPDDARLARAKQLPPLPPDGADGAIAPASVMTVSGEVSIAAALSGRAGAGATLFIAAKSVDSPGAPVAVLRTTVGAWPVKFTLDDSQSMVPGRNLTSAGRVTVEARISQSGQALPAAGDLQGSTGAINPADHRPLKIVIDRVIG